MPYSIALAVLGLPLVLLAAAVPILTAISIGAVATWFGFLWLRRRDRVRAAAVYAAADE